MRQCLKSAVLSNLFLHYSLKTEFISENNVGDDDLFDIASMTKGYLHLCFLILEDQGRINLTDKVLKYIPDFSGKYSSEVELIHLITNTVSFDIENWRQVGVENLYEEIIKSGFKYKPVSDHEYTNLQAFLLGLILEKIIGLDLGSAMHSILPKKYFSGLTFNPAESIVKSSSTISIGEIHDPLSNIYRKETGKSIGVSGLFASVETIYKTGMFFTETELGGRLYLKILNGFSYSGGKAGLGFTIWDNKSYTGNVEFDKNTIFNMGFTGCILYVNVRLNKIIVLMTNSTYFPDLEGDKADRMYDFRKRLVQSLI
ncbi:MAG TPA: class A beta-lactamase-related serine hydrolase [Candidatus Pacebacteria bacterium]|nr:class A beta-lactamase-related serine hydrolase [Candidatus Paceibacterota bacterium]